MLKEKFATLPCNGVGLTPPFDGVSVYGGRWNGRRLFLLGGRGLGACEVWCFMANSSPRHQIVFYLKIRCMVPLKWQFREFFLNAADAFLCVAL